MAAGDQRTLRDTSPYGTATAMTVGTVYPAGRAVIISCTVTGNIVVKLADGSTMTLAVPVGLLEFTWASIGIVTSGTTATATYYNLY